MVRRVMKDAFVVWKNSRSIFGLTNYFAGQPRVAGAILSILFGLFLSACGGGGGAGSPPNPITITDRMTTTMGVPCPPESGCPIFVDAPVQGLHYRPVGPTTDISLSHETGGRGGFMSTVVFRSTVISRTGTVAFAVGEITVDGDGLTLDQYKSNGLLGFIVHPAGEWTNTVWPFAPVVFTPYDLSEADGNTTVNVGAVARVLQGFDRPRPSTSPVGADTDDDPLILIHEGATAERTVMFDQPASGVFSVRELSGVGIVQANDDNYPITISETSEYGAITLFFPHLAGAMETLSMVIADMADEIARFPNNSKKITLNSRNAPNPYFARRGAYSLIPGGSGATIDPDTGSLTYKPTEGVSPANVSVVFQYADQISINQAVELDSLPRTDSENFQIYFTGGKPVALTLKETTGGNLPLRYELDPLSELKRYELIFDHESGILSGTPQQEAFTVNVALDIFDSGGDDAKPLVPDLEFQIVSREGEPAYYEIDLRGGAGSFATLHFPDRDGNEVSEESTEESIAGIDSACQDGSAAGFGKTNCPYSADYIFGGAKHPEGLGDIPGVMVVIGLKSTGGGNTVCSSVDSTCPAGVKAFTISFQNENDGKPLSVNARVLLPRPAFDPAFASEIFATYIQDSPNPSRRPLPAADGGNGRLIYSVTPLPGGLTLHSATRRLLGRPTVTVSSDMPFALTMTVADLNGKKESKEDGTRNFINSADYIFTVVVQPDRKPEFREARNPEGTPLTLTIFTSTLNISTALTLPEIATITLNRATIYSVSDNIPPGMTFDLTTRELSGTPTDLGRFSGRFSIDYVATDPDEELDENGDLITPMTLRVGDDDKATLTVVVFVDDEPSFGGQTVPVQSYTENTSIALLTLPRADGGNPPLNYTLTDLASLSLSAAGVLSGIPRTSGNFQLIYTVTDTDLSEESSDSAALTVIVNIDGDSAPEFDGGFGPLTLTQTWPITITQPIILPAAARGGNFATLYSIQEALPGDLRFDPRTRGLSGTPTVAGMFTIRLIAEDMDGNTMAIDEDILEVIITVVADIAPVLPAVSNQGYIQNSRIVNLTLPEATGGNGSVTMYSLTTLGGLTFNSDHTVRVLSGTPRVFGDFTLVYIATDSDPLTPEAGPDSATVSITINIEEDTVPSFTESVPQQNYFEGATIAMTVLPEASGGNGDPLTYEESGLPTGIMFDRASRQLSGAPTEPGSFVATIVARDTDGNTDESDNGVLTFGISVEADTQPSFGSLTVSNQTYTLSVRISPLRLPAATGGNGQLIYSVSDDLPPGLAFNDNTQTDNTRIINLTPTTAGTYTVVYTVEDGNGDTRSLTFTITVVAS